MFSSNAVLIAIVFLLIDSALELALISNMVRWLHVTGGGQFDVRGPDGETFSLHGKPQNLLVDQGHTSNAAAGTALIIVSLGGLLILTLRRNQLRRHGNTKGFVSFFYIFWLTFTVLSVLLTLTALIYVNVLTYEHDGQGINVALASTLNNRPYPDYVAYPRLEWTPLNWYLAVLDLRLVSQSVRNDIQLQITLMRGWQWNLIPMIVLGLIVMGLALMDYFAQRNGRSRGAERLAARDKAEGYA